jgi:proline dehydrogenase
MSQTNRLLVLMIQLLPKSLVKAFAMRYIAGEKLEDAVRVVRMLNGEGFMATVDVLGEHVRTEKESLLAVKACEEVLRVIYEHHLNGNLSIKLTQFGLNIDQDFCLANVRNLLEMARGYSNFVRIDMEDSSTTSATLKLYERVRSEGFENTGVVIQTYLRRSQDDVKRLVEMKGNVRLCKGAYVEPEAIAFKDREEIRANYLKLLKTLLEAKGYVGIAIHDDVLVRGAYQYIHEMSLQKSNYEFQMLYGVKPKLRDKILADGHRLRIYIPFGESWYAYSMRRFQENPQLARTVFRSFLFRK